MGRFRAVVGLVIISAVVLLVSATTASALSPSVGTKAADNVNDSTATLDGTVNPNGLETKMYFEYGPTTSYGTKTSEVAVGAGSSSLEKAQPVTGLTPNTTYHYRVVASNADGASTGGDRTFTVGWTLQTVANPTTAGVFQDVSCASATECTAVGVSGTQAIAQRWNGTEWKAQTVPKPEGATETALYGVSCPTSSACTAVGRFKNSSAKWVSLVEVWNGTEWKVQASPNPTATGVELSDVSCLSSSECAAVGYSWNSGPPETRQTLAMRWDGTEWKIQTTSNQSEYSQATSVSCRSATSCVAGAVYVDSFSQSSHAYSLVWSGGNFWSYYPTASVSGAFQTWISDVSCTSSLFYSCTAVGEKEVNTTTHETQTLVERWNGSSWSLQTSPNPEAAKRDLEGVSCTSENACTASGFLVTSSGTESLMSMKWNGSTWTSITGPVPSGSTKAKSLSTSCIATRGCAMVGQFVNGSSVVVPLAAVNWRSAPPSAVPNPASSIGEKGVTLSAVVNPNGAETKAYFEYGQTVNYGSKTEEVNVGSGTSPVEISVPVSGLTPGTHYYFHVVANNENPETNVSFQRSFTTMGPPTVSYLVAEVDKTTSGAATLRAKINPAGFSTTYQFEYGTASGVYTKTVPIPAASLGSGLEEKTVTYKVSGLTPGTKYYYRATATNEKGKTDGTETFFTAVGAPGVTTLAASGIARNCATLKGTVVPYGLSTKYQFEYGPTTSYGSKVPVSPQEIGSETESKSVEELVCGLAPNTLYHYRLVAENSAGSTSGSDQSLTTLPTVSLYAKGSLLAPGAELKAFSSNLTFTGNGFGTYSCAESEFAGSVAENPGALQSVSTTRFQHTGGANCSVPASSFNTKYTVATKGITVEYTTNQFGEGIGATNKFTLNATYFLGTFKMGECEYSLQLSGTYSLKSSLTPLTPVLSGKSQLIKTISGSCPASETASGSFAVTSNGNTVETIK